MFHRWFTVCSVVMAVAGLSMSAGADQAQRQSAADSRAITDFTRRVAGVRRAPSAARRSGADRSCVIRS